MKKQAVILFTATALVAFGCNKTENNNTNTATTDTTVTASATDTTLTSTSGSGSTTDTSNTASTTGMSGTTSTGATGGTIASPSLSDKDRTFIMKAAQGGMAEVAGGQTASSQASSADVKAFGQRMVTDHSRANSELAQLATTKGLALPTETDAEHKSKLAKMSGMTGSAFDKAYMKDMVEDHEKDVKEFEEASKSASDPDLKAWAAKTLPILRDHLQMAKATQAKVK